MAHKSLAHPSGVFLYRVSYRHKSIIYATDIEQKRDGNPDAGEFIRGADLLIHDAQYLEAEYLSRSSSRRGWGHSTVERAVKVARKAGVKRLILFHHDPDHDDRTLKRIARLSKRLLPSTRVAYERLEIRLLITARAQGRVAIYIPLFSGLSGEDIAKVLGRIEETSLTAPGQIFFLKTIPETLFMSSKR